VISWKPGYVSRATGRLEFGGWIWRYDLTQLGPGETEVTLTYDWSAVGPAPRQRIQFPPFTPDHLGNSLSHLAAIVDRVCQLPGACAAKARPPRCARGSAVAAAKSGIGARTTRRRGASFQARARSITPPGGSPV